MFSPRFLEDGSKLSFGRPIKLATAGMCNFHLRARSVMFTADKYLQKFSNLIELPLLDWEIFEYVDLAAEFFSNMDCLYFVCLEKQTCPEMFCI